MRHRRAPTEGIVLAALCAAALGACGSQTQLPEAPATAPLAASDVSVTTTGNAAATVIPSSVTFTIDNSGSLVVHLQVRSTSGASETLALRGSLLDSTGTPIGDVTGGSVDVGPGSTVGVELDGPAPHGTISSATFELTTQASPTPTSATPGGSISTPPT